MFSAEKHAAADRSFEIQSAFRWAKFSRLTPPAPERDESFPIFLLEGVKKIRLEPEVRPGRIYGRDGIRAKAGQGAEVHQSSSSGASEQPIGAGGVPMGASGAESRDSKRGSEDGSMGVVSRGSSSVVSRSS